MKYLVELAHSHLPADYVLSELHLEFGRAPQPTGDPDILKLKVDSGSIAVLCDYDNNRVWITINTDSETQYTEICARIEKMLNRTRHVGNLKWSQLEIGED
jgi:hypothetical protein